MRYYDVSKDPVSDKCKAPDLAGTEESIEVDAMYESVVNFMNLSDQTRIDSMGTTWSEMKKDMMEDNYEETSYFKSWAPLYQTRIRYLRKMQ